ncbi:hypothetical protein CMV_000395 [Castanea mollissima]|uniref:Uncharacterized protein n=1 Tax=Castanea mollissima TaxID=60419 RepID=A0A8J4VXQ9_9ROSI|nr:hypothetical protein CMV_000395 [Castanea mollissima]
MIVDFYTKLFSSSNPSGLEVVIQHTMRVVSADMNVGLIEEFTRLEVEIALKQIAPLEAPDPDAESASFCSFLLSRQIQSCVRCALSQNPRSYLLIFPQQDWTLACGYSEDTEDVIDVSGLMTYLLVCSSSSKST